MRMNIKKVSNVHITAHSMYSHITITESVEEPEKSRERQRERERDREKDNTFAKYKQVSAMKTMMSTKNKEEDGRRVKENCSLLS